MEFEEMRKIWDSQNNAPIYAIDEETLYKRIKSKGNRASRIANTNEIGLTIIFVTVSILLHIIDQGTIYAYVTSFLTLSIAGYVVWGRIKRKRGEKQFDRSMLGELDQAIFNLSNEITRVKTLIWWMLLPVGLPVFINMIVSEFELWKWLIIPAAFILAYSLARWELNKRHLPRRRELEKLRKILVE